MFRKIDLGSLIVDGQGVEKESPVAGERRNSLLTERTTGSLPMDVGVSDEESRVRWTSLRENQVGFEGLSRLETGSSSVYWR